MSHLPHVLDAFSRLLSYPHEGTPQAAELLYVVLRDELPDAASDLSQFGVFVEQSAGWQLEEAFTGTFDVNPACALEVGWQLFGEEYARGMFLVRMRQELRKYGLAESRELPDHISHVLAVLAAMPEEQAAKFVPACVQPAVAKMNAALAGKDTPYRHVVSCLLKVIEHKWGAGQTSAPDSVLAARSAPSDPLHAFPVAAVGCGSGCGNSYGEPDVVELVASFPADKRQRATVAPKPENGP